MLRQVGDGADHMEGWSNRGSRCFKCGGTGHWAKDCEVVSAVAVRVLRGAPRRRPHVGHSLPGAADRAQEASVAAGESLDNLQLDAGAPGSSALPKPPVGPVVDVAGNYVNVLEEPTDGNLESVLRDVFSFEQFRGLQVPTIQRMLRGESCLSIMPTGTALVVRVECLASAPRRI